MKKKPIILVSTILIFLFMTLQFTFKSAASSPSDSTPAVTAMTTPTTAVPSVTPVNQSNGPVIQAVLMAVDLPQGILGVSTLYIADSQGGPVTDASVTLSGNSNSSPLTCKGVEPCMNGAASLYGVTQITGGIYQNSMDIAFGKSYTFNVNFGGASYASTVTAITADPVITTGSLGVTCSWNKNFGNASLIIVGEKGKDNVLWNVGSPIPDDPYIVPGAAFSNETPGDGLDAIFLQIIQLNQGSFPGCGASSFTLFMNERQAVY